MRLPVGGGDNLGDGGTLSAGQKINQHLLFAVATLARLLGWAVVGSLLYLGINLLLLCSMPFLLLWLIEFRRRCTMLQHQVLVYQLCRPVWQRWLELAVLAGSLPISIGDFQKNRRAYLAAKWIPQGWDWADPLKDQQAEQLAVRNGFKSRSEVVSELGYDAEEIDAEIAADNERADSLGLILDSDPRKVAKTGAVQQPADNTQS